MWFEFGDVFDGDGFVVFYVEVFLGMVFFELQWQDIYIDQVGVVDMFEVFGDNCFDVQQV